MRIQPVINNYGVKNTPNKIDKTHTQFEKNDINTTIHHQYTGVPSIDLAYASMYDYNIARDLKLMGLI